MKLYYIKKFENIANFYSLLYNKKSEKKEG